MPTINPFTHAPDPAVGKPPARPWLKICGVTDPDNALDAINAGADLIGLNLWPQSRRYLSPEKQHWAAELADRTTLVGVFVNAPLQDIQDAAKRLRLSAIQLHGDESAGFATKAAKTTGLPVIKALGLTADQGLSPTWQPYPWLLLDAHDPVQRGGTGRTIDWTAAATVIRSHPLQRVLLAGGLNPDNAAEALRTVRPWAIDIASGAESSPGIKDPAKVAALAAIVRASTNGPRHQP